MSSSAPQDLDDIELGSDEDCSTHSSGSNPNRDQELGDETRTIHDQSGLEDDTRSTPRDEATPSRFMASKRHLLNVLPCFLIFLVAHGFAATPIHAHERPTPISSIDVVVDGKNYTEKLWNPEHSQEILHETVPGGMLYAIAVYIPMALQILLSYFLARRSSSRGNDKLSAAASVTRATSTWFVAIGVCIICTDAIKLYVGYLRPIFLTECRPDVITGECTVSFLEERHLRTSFPSGHSSLTFCGMMLLAQFLRKSIQDGCMRNKGSVAPGSLSYKFALLLSYAPILVAIFVATSRVHDNKHFPADIIAGALLGGSVAIVVHGIWYDENDGTESKQAEDHLPTKEKC